MDIAVHTRLHMRRDMHDTPSWPWHVVDSLEPAGFQSQ